MKVHLSQGAGAVPTVGFVTWLGRLLGTEITLTFQKMSLLSCRIPVKQRAHASCPIIHMESVCARTGHGPHSSSNQMPQHKNRSHSQSLVHHWALVFLSLMFSWFLPFLLTLITRQGPRIQTPERHVLHPTMQSWALSVCDQSPLQRQHPT